MYFKTVFSYIDNESQMKQLAFSVQIQNKFISQGKRPSYRRAAVGCVVNETKYSTRPILTQVSLLLLCKGKAFVPLASTSSAALMDGFSDVRELTNRNIPITLYVVVISRHVHHTNQDILGIEDY
ncbi:hypothetical protein OUZ56_026823 [Daphnia magna]|uniref:Uncharacterized protein n=1 Tax=Daphnia magna TaxID=35525 RepID=A0ABQ9ZMY5_9CRUS|nr:hypothetical protein OUZ56_026823 [Daphnia magna]